MLLSLPANIFGYQVNLAIPPLMFAIGLLIGFLGIGGGGLVIAALVGLFAVPIHEAIAVSLGSMFFSIGTGAFSHFREGNVVPRMGTEVGLAAILGAYFGASLALLTKPETLKFLAGLALISWAVLIYWRTRMIAGATGSNADRAKRKWMIVYTGPLGVGGGMLAGFLGLGGAPVYQVGMLFINRHLTLHQVIGTTMIVMSSTSLIGAIRYFQGGVLDLTLLATVIVGLSVGAYVGAKLTRRVPQRLLRAFMIGAPVIAGTIVILV